MLQGRQSWLFENQPIILAAAAVVGPEEGKGPLAEDFDIVHGDLTMGQETWEKSEKHLMEEAANLVLKKAKLTKPQINFFCGGDLMNQIISSSFAARTLAIPFIGMFGACSTSMESLALAAMMVDSGNADYCMAGTCSHNCTVEKQFRYPTEYGSQKPPTAQFTVTGAGAVIVSNQGEGPIITRATIGRVIDMGITDPFNMGGAMAPAAMDTIEAHFRDFGLDADHYDLIITGDLAKVGSEILHSLFAKHSLNIDPTTHRDCGVMIFDPKKQLVQSGGSGCACSATVVYGHFLKKIKKGELRRILIVATGALLSPLSFQQKESIPCIAHAVAIEHKGED